MRQEIRGHADAPAALDHPSQEGLNLRIPRLRELGPKHAADDTNERGKAGIREGIRVQRVLAAGEADLLHLTDLHAAEFHGQADTQTRDGLHEVGLDVQFVLRNSPAPNRTTGHHDQSQGDQDKETDPKIVRLCVHPINLFQSVLGFADQKSSCQYGLANRPVEELTNHGIVALIAQLLRFARRNDRLGIFIDHNRTVGHSENARQLVGNKHEGNLQVVRQIQDQLVDLGRSNRVQTGRRLIEKQNLRVHGQGPGNGGTFAIPPLSSDGIL